MGKKAHSSEEIIRKLRQAEVLLHGGKSVAEACRELEVTDATYYKWRKEYGGMKMDQAKRLKDLERENSELKKMLAELLLMNRVREAVCEKSCEPGHAPGSGPQTG